MMGYAEQSARRRIYFIDSPEHPFDLPKMPADLGCDIVKVPVADWNDALTPWPAQGLRHREPFGGHADATLGALLERVEADAAVDGDRAGTASVAGDFRATVASAGVASASRAGAVPPIPPVPPAPCAIAGYSLGGLFALYAFVRSDRFMAAASLSGSLWYDGWNDFLATADFPGEGRFAYLSLGTKEKRGMRERLKTVEDETRRTETILRAKGVETRFALTPGAHFDHVEDRIASGLSVLGNYLSTGA